MILIQIVRHAALDNCNHQKLHSTHLLPLGPSKHRLALGTAVEYESINRTQRLYLRIFSLQIIISEAECTVTALLFLHNVTYTFHQFEDNGHIGT